MIHISVQTLPSHTRQTFRCAPQKQSRAQGVCSAAISTWDLWTGEDDAVDFYGLCGEVVAAGGERQFGHTHIHLTGKRIRADGLGG